MGQQLVSFSEPLYGEEGEDQIIADGLTLATRLNNPYVGGGKIKQYQAIRGVMSERFSSSDYNRLAQHAPELEEGLGGEGKGGHSGASFSAVLWAAASFLGGYSIKVGMRYILNPDGTRDELYS